MHNEIKKTLSFFCGLDDIPKTNLVGSKLKWFASDSEEAFKNNKNSAYDGMDIEYAFNSYGYRCQDFDVRADERVLVIGCSHTLGVGVPYHRSWPYLFQEKIQERTGRSTVLWNLGMCGESNDYIARMARSAVPVLQPTIVIVLFTGSSRREYYDLYGNRFAMGPWMANERLYGYRKEITAAYFNLHSEYADCMNFLKNYFLIESILNAHDVSWLFSFPVTEVEFARSIEHLVDKDRFISSYYQHLDFARDNLHAGLRSNSVFAEDAFTACCNIYPEKVKRALNERWA